MFMHICLHFDDVITPGSRPMKPISWLKLFFDSWSWYEALEGLVDSAALLVQKLWQNNRILIR